MSDMVSSVVSYLMMKRVLKRPIHMVDTFRCVYDGGGYT